jgi:hypothetical protein
MGSMAAFTSSLLTELSRAVARWVDQHPVLAVLVGIVMPLALLHWNYTLRPYLTAENSTESRLRTVSPDSLSHGRVPFPAARLLDSDELAAFGQWLMPHLVRHGMTQTELARRLKRPIAEVYAAMYGVPVGKSLPSLAVVDAICDLLELGRADGRAAFCRSVPARSRGGLVSNR